MDMLDIVDYGDSDVWSVTDFSSCSSDVDVEDNCAFNIISVFRLRCFPREGFRSG